MEIPVGDSSVIGRAIGTPVWTAVEKPIYFPGGTPKSGHDDSPHEHVVIDKDGCVLFWRAEDGEILVDGGKDR